MTRPMIPVGPSRREHRMRTTTPRALAAIGALALAASGALGGDTTGFEWCTITDPGNAAYDRYDPNGSVTGHGSVDYAYRVSKTEVSSGQWVEFLNAFGDYGDPHGVAYDLYVSAIERDRTYTGTGTRWTLRDDWQEPERFGVWGINWFNAARYCNWLHHGKTDDLSKLEYGAYDLRDVVNNVPPERSPDARYWLPSLDEYMKAAYYDPDKDGQGQGGWWLQPNGTDNELIAAPPYEGGETNGGLTGDDASYTDALTFRLGAYADTTSPWGLLDLSGGSPEWLETSSSIVPDYFRFRAGSSAFFDLSGGNGGPLDYDSAGVWWADTTWYAYENSFRVATAVPVPGMGMTVLACGCFMARRRGRAGRGPRLGPA